jgi:predicted acetyltransferase
MSISYRRPTEHEHVPMVRTFIDVMNQKLTDEEIAEGADDFELDRSWAAVDDDTGAIVGTNTAHSYEFTLPGGTTAALGGLTLVSVVPTHRRRGISRELVTRFFADCRDRGEAFGGLFATEAGIYGRYGFGPATRFASLTIERDRADGIGSIVDTGRIRWQPAHPLAAELAAIFERTRHLRAGELVRKERFWTSRARRLERGYEGKPVWSAIHDNRDGVADGYVVYRIESKWIDHTPQNEVHILELVGAGPARLALWKFLLELDLVRSVKYGAARLDEPLHDVLTDARQLRTTGVFDELQLRIVDVAAALSARRYSHDGAFSIDVRDDACPDQSGRYRLDINDGVGACERAGSAGGAAAGECADVTTTSRALATAFLGDRSWRSLADAGVVQLANPPAGARIDAAFATGISPQCLTVF